VATDGRIYARRVTVDGPVVDPGAFADLLASGAPGAGPVSGDPALVVVDLDGRVAGDGGRAGDGPSRPGWRRPPRPFVAVGVSTTGAIGGIESAGASLDDLDVVLLEGASNPPDPWVGVHDATAALETLRTSVARSPLAAVTLAHVLRAGVDLPFVDALVVESLGYSTLQRGPEFARWLAARPAPTAPGSPAVEDLTADRVGDELHVVLDRPRVRNALSASLRDALWAALEVAVQDPSVATVRLSGRGPDFCSGGDLDEFGTTPDPATAHLVRTSRSPAAAVATMSERVVAQVHGSCVGAGIEIAAAAGRVVARPDARFWLPELAIGLIPGAGGTASLPRRVGRHRTAWMALTGSPVDVGTALEWGLVDEVAAG
jgi:hypothetical protein